MAIIHGIADSESNLLDKLPNEVENIEDIDRVKKEFEEKLAKEKSGFFGGIKKWNYYAFITPECFRAIEVYREKWTKHFGVEPKPEDPFFANTRSKTVKPLTLMPTRHIESF
ncbi:MAG: hypothetical protein ACW9XA_08075 [Candidatus Nitrosopumilus sp. bin_6a]